MKQTFYLISVLIAILLQIATAKLKRETLSEETIQKLRNEKEQRYTDSDRYCCKIDYPILSDSNYVNVAYTYQGSQVVAVGSTDCGLFGWSSCTVYGTRYFTSTAYRQELVVKYRLGECPAEYKVCCNGFVMSNGVCLNIQTELLNPTTTTRTIPLLSTVVSGLFPVKPILNPFPIQLIEVKND